MTMLYNPSSCFVSYGSIGINLGDRILEIAATTILTVLILRFWESKEFFKTEIQDLIIEYMKNLFSF